MKFLSLKNHQSAFMLPTVLITSIFLTMVGLSVAQLATNNYQVAVTDVRRLDAQFAADAGADYAIVELNADNDYAGTSGEVELSNTNNIRQTYEVSITTHAYNDKTIITTGRVYFPAAATEPTSTRTYAVDMRGIGVPDGGSLGDFSLVTGVGGLIMENSAKIVDGEVFVNGEIIMRNSAQIGLASNPITVKAAHQNCPTTGGASYPTVCTSGEPISIENPAWIYADVCATNQVDDSRMSDGGLDTSCVDPAPETLPDHDRDAQKAAVANTISGDYDCDSNTAKWTLPANTRITGDFDIQKKCEITILGDLWIEGDFSMINSSKLIISDSLADTRPIIMVDGSNGAYFNNSAEIVSNSSDTGAELITYYSVAGCSPDCADVTGNDLYNSRNISTIFLQQSAQAPESVLYARWTRAQLDNGGDIGAIVGQTVLLQNSAAVTFGASVGTGGGGPADSSIGTWLVDGYRREL